jgi:two-component system, OmpR family, sensor histidine kinase MtrB
VGLRGRLALALVALVTITVLGIGVGTYVFVDARLRDSLLADATRQAQFNLSVLVPDALPDGATSASFAASGLARAFKLRGDLEVLAEFGPGDRYQSSLALTGAIDDLPAALRATVRNGLIGYAWRPLAGEPVLVVGGQAAITGRPELYFVFQARTIDLALGQLRLGLAAGGVIAILLALAIARLVAGGILRPVRSGSQAAARIAAGDLTARVPGGGSDELAAWAAEFNRMADSLAATIGRLEWSESQNRRFVAEVAHELRTPLTALLGEAALIEAGAAELPTDARRAAELLVADVRRLRTLVEDLMELSRFDARAEAADLGPVDLGAALGTIVATRLPRAAVSLPPVTVIVDSEVRRIDRIIGNLLDNARTHAPGGAVEVGLALDQGDAVVTVADGGPGVEPEALAHLFDRFYKADPSRTGGSSGLGLAIAAEHAALLGGSLTAAARDGGGLVFTLRLPVTRPLPAGDGDVIAGRERGRVPGGRSAPAEPREAQ